MTKNICDEMRKDMKSLGKVSVSIMGDCPKEAEDPRSDEEKKGK